MASIKVTKTAGLWTSDNPYGTTPEGSFSQADNVVIRNRDVVEPRRGQAPLSYATGTGSFDTFASYGTSLIAVNSSGNLYEDTGAAMTRLTAQSLSSPSSGQRMKLAEARENLYFTSSIGLKMISSRAAHVPGDPVPRVAGVPPPFDLYDGVGPATVLSGNPSAAGTWLPKNSAVAYRAVLARKDVNGYLKLSAPSGRFVVINPDDSSVAIGGLTRAGTTVTATTAAAHGLRVGDIFQLDAAEARFAQGPFTILTVPSSTTFTYTDASSALTPSLAAHTITSGTKNVSFRVYFPSSATTTRAGDILMLFRSERSPTDDIDPGDELFQVREQVLTSTDITNTYVTITDITPESALSSTPLYTNPDTGDGIDEANGLPPLCNDVTYWQDRLWFGNTISQDRYELQILGVGSPDGIQNGDILFVHGKPYEFYSSSPSGSYTGVYFSTTGTASQNIAVAATNLVNQINQNANTASTGIRAAYLSGANDAPGKILIEESIPTNSGTTSPFYVGASRSGSFSPVLATTSLVDVSSARAGSTVTINTTTNHGLVAGNTFYLGATSPSVNFGIGLKTVVTAPSSTQLTYTESGTATTFPAGYVVCPTTTYSSDDDKPNGVYFSKLQEPEAVPALNYVTVGTKASNILRIVPLREKLFVFKEEGLYTISGEYPFRVDLFDSTVKLVAPDSIAVVANKIFALTTQGVVAITDGGAAIVSRPIELDILPLLTNSTAAFKRACFGVGYETERQYLLWLPSSSSGSSCTQAYVYHVLNNTWTRRTDAATGGIVSSSDYLYLGTSSSPTLSKERKSFDRTDYADSSQTFTVLSSTATAVTGSDVSTVTVGDFFDRDGTSRGVITSVDEDTNSFVFANESSTPPPVGDGTIYKAFTSTVVYNPQTGGEPGASKQFSKVSFHFGSAPDFELGYITSKTDLNTTTKSDLFALGGFDYENSPVFCVPRENQRAAEIQVGFSITNAWGKWRLFGHTLTADVTSELVAR